MTTPAMFLIATILPAAAVAAAEPLTRASEVPELASMALLSIVLVGVSVAVRRTGPKPDDRDRRDGGLPRS